MFKDFEKYNLLNFFNDMSWEPLSFLKTGNEFITFNEYRNLIENDEDLFPLSDNYLTKTVLKHYMVYISVFNSFYGELLSCVEEKKKFDDVYDNSLKCYFNKEKIILRFLTAFFNDDKGKKLRFINYINKNSISDKWVNILTDFKNEADNHDKVILKKMLQGVFLNEYILYIQYVDKLISVINEEV